MKAIFAAYLVFFGKFSLGALLISKSRTESFFFLPLFFHLIFSIRQANGGGLGTF